MSTVERSRRRSAITYRIAVGPQAGRKVFTLQTLPACDPEESFGDTVGKVGGFSLHAGVAARAANPNLPLMAWRKHRRNATRP